RGEYFTHGGAALLERAAHRPDDATPAAPASHRRRRIRRRLRRPSVVRPNGNDHRRRRHVRDVLRGKVLRHNLRQLGRQPHLVRNDDELRKLKLRRRRLRAMRPRRLDARVLPGRSARRALERHDRRLVYGHRDRDRGGRLQRRLRGRVPLPRIDISTRRVALRRRPTLCRRAIVPQRHVVIISQRHVIIISRRRRPPRGPLKRACDNRRREISTELADHRNVEPHSAAVTVTKFRTSHPSPSRRRAPRSPV
ncbi:unnamed protein product, partial [Pelagomonas calceolata]